MLIYYLITGHSYLKLVNKSDNIFINFNYRSFIDFWNTGKLNVRGLPFSWSQF